MDFLPWHNLDEYQFKKPKVSVSNFPRFSNPPFIFYSLILWDRAATGSFRAWGFVSEDEWWSRKNKFEKFPKLFKPEGKSRPDQETWLSNWDRARASTIFWAAAAAAKETWRLTGQGVRKHGQKATEGWKSTTDGHPKVMWRWKTGNKVSQTCREALESWMVHSLACCAGGPGSIPTVGKSKSRNIQRIFRHKVVG